MHTGERRLQPWHRVYDLTSRDKLAVDDGALEVEIVADLGDSAVVAVESGGSLCDIVIIEGHLDDTQMLTPNCFSSASVSSESEYDLLELGVMSASSSQSKVGSVYSASVTTDFQIQLNIPGRG